MRANRLPPLWTWVAMAVAVSAGAAPPTPAGPRARFLGWDPDSSRFAYTMGRPGKRQFSFLKAPHLGGVAKALKFDGSVTDLVERRGFVINELAGQRLSDTVQAFLVAPGRTLRVVLEVGRRKLSYVIWLDEVERPTEPKRLLRGYFQVVWTDFQVRAFPSPDGRWMALVLTMSTPWETRARVEGVQVSEGAAP